MQELLNRAWDYIVLQNVETMGKRLDFQYWASTSIFHVGQVLQKQMALSLVLEFMEQIVAWNVKNPQY